MLAPKLKEYLDKEKVKYEAFQHPEAFTASEIAGLQHVPGAQFAKCVIVKANDKYLVLVLSAAHRVDLEKVKKAVKAEDISLVSEKEIGRLFPDFQAGAEPPFGNLYGLKVYADRALADNSSIVFTGGTYTDLVKMKWDDFVRLAKPVISDFGQHL
jgi:Ala-tRNA(Pro) deacylase